ncbi:MAG: hypothetical protein KY475_10220 [Planctomycetes bacterium]|nr:hypothetical protein [Planctomycetota bacterium]
MDIFGRTELNELLEHEKEPCLSIYFPTERTGRDFEQNPIRLRNLLREAEGKLTEWGMRSPDAREMLKRPTDLAGDMQFWKQRSDGMAIFASPEFYRHYRVPASFDETVHLGRRFFVKPLLPLLHTDGAFYVLALSQKKVRLYRATRKGMDEIELKGVADNMDEALQREDLQSHLQHRSWGPRDSGKRRPNRSLGAEPAGSAVFHGQGSDEDQHKDEVAEFFKMIDNAVAQKLAAEQAPLLLACVEYEAALYREHNHYKGLLDATVLGSSEKWNTTELHRRAWEAVQPHFEARQQEELSKFNTLPADRISTDLKSIADAAEVGRVEALFLARGNNGNGGKPEASPTDEMLDFTAAAVLRTGGDVFALPPEKMPQNAQQAAAVFRYAMS